MRVCVCVCERERERERQRQRQRDRQIVSSVVFSGYTYLLLHEAFPPLHHRDVLGIRQGLVLQCGAHLNGHVLQLVANQHV